MNLGDKVYILEKSYNSVLVYSGTIHAMDINGKLQIKTKNEIRHTYFDTGVYTDIKEWKKKTRKYLNKLFKENK